MCTPRVRGRLLCLPSLPAPSGTLRPLPGRLVDVGGRRRPIRLYSRACHGRFCAARRAGDTIQKASAHAPMAPEPAPVPTGRTPGGPANRRPDGSRGSCPGRVPPPSRHADSDPVDARHWTGRPSDLRPHPLIVPDGTASLDDVPPVPHTVTHGENGDEPTPWEKWFNVGLCAERALPLLAAWTIRSSSSSRGNCATSPLISRIVSPGSYLRRTNHTASTCSSSFNFCYGWAISRRSTLHLLTAVVRTFSFAP